MDIMIGCDPEVFVKKGRSFVTAHGMIPGDKANPFKVPHGAVQVDGMALEFNIDPAKTRTEFVTNVVKVYERLNKMLPADHHLEVVPTAHFNQAYFDGVPAAAKVLGCDPDYSAYTGMVNPRPEGNQPMRTAAGHIHASWTSGKDPMNPYHFKDCREVAKQMDYYVGYWSRMWDPDKERRRMYGKAGCFRPKPYGMEYRSPSNAWLKSEALMGWIFDAAVKAIVDLKEGGSVEQQYKVRGLNQYAKHIVDGDGYFAPEDATVLQLTGLKLPPKV